MMMLLKQITHPKQLYWWQWCQVLGLCLPVLFICLEVKHPLLWALAAHFLADFTTQSTQTAIGKARGDRWTLVYHAFIAGGYAGLIAGGLPGLVISVAIHYWVDAANKFGLDEPAGPALDQATHLLTLVAIWWLL